VAGDDASGGEAAKARLVITIVALALMIPLAAVLGAQAWFPWLVGLALVIGGGTLSVRYLLDHQHKLRLEEIEAQRKVLEEERNQLDIANRILEADEEALRRDLGEPGSVGG
jgi:hypothetical protein